MLNKKEIHDLNDAMTKVNMFMSLVRDGIDLKSSAGQASVESASHAAELIDQQVRPLVNSPRITTSYNAAFFNLYTQVILLSTEKMGQSSGLAFATELFSRALGAAYLQMGFSKGLPAEFARVVSLRDQAVGLDVRFPKISANQIIYQFHTDPFPLLKGRFEPSLVDRCYMQFKVDFLLGTDWFYETSQHIWNGAPYTEHIISKK